MINNLIYKTLNGIGDSDKHLMLLYSIVIGSNAKNIIELGVRNGDTTIPLVLGAKETNGMIYSVDIEENNLILNEEFKKHNIFFKQDALNFLNNWNEDDCIDLIYIDDWHAYDHVKKELEIGITKNNNFITRFNVWRFLSFLSC